MAGICGFLWYFYLCRTFVNYGFSTTSEAWIWLACGISGRWWKFPLESWCFSHMTMHLQLHWNMGKYKHNLVRSYGRENLQLPNSFLHTQEYSYGHVWDASYWCCSVAWYLDFLCLGAVFGREFLGHTVRQQLPRPIHNVKLFHVSSLMLLSR
jgi:hypothetical protein